MKHSLKLIYLLVVAAIMTLLVVYKPAAPSANAQDVTNQLRLLALRQPKYVGACEAKMDYVDVKWQQAYCKQLKHGFNNQTGEWR